MPELPEVETTRAGLAPHLIGQTITGWTLRRGNLRWAIPPEIQLLQGAVITALRRRAKYLLMDTDAGSALWHLGMSGNLRVLAQDQPVRTHDHVDARLGNNMALRFHDPRRFGCLLYQAPNSVHALLQNLGPEPLSDAFNADLLWAKTRGRAAPIKHLLMDQSVVVGVGNIYAAEALFECGVRPQRPAGKLTRAECLKLCTAVKRILTHAIQRGGTTLRDFIQPDGQPGYFEQELFVYGRQGQPCRACGAAITAAVLGPRQSLYCPRCQR